jgi:hypothetical protein
MKRVADASRPLTFGRFEPRRLATSISQRLSLKNRVIRDSRTLAASSRVTVRTLSSPVGVILPVTSFHPYDLSPIPESALQTFCGSPGRPSGRNRAGFQNAQFHIQQLPEKLLARDRRRSDLLRSNRFGTCWNHPISGSCASPQSLWSVFTCIADSTASTCRVSSRTVSNPACQPGTRPRPGQSFDEPRSPFLLTA